MELIDIFGNPWLMVMAAIIIIGIIILLTSGQPSEDEYR